MIPQLRIDEYNRRKENLSRARKQVLQPRQRPVPANIHVVYAMTHVSVCGGVKVIFEHANHLHRLGVRVTIVAHYPKPDWFPIEADYTQVPFGMELAKGIPLCDVIVATYWDHIQACIETGIAPVVYFEQGDAHLFDADAMPGERRQFVQTQLALPERLITVSARAARSLQNLYGRSASVFHNACDATLFRADGPVYEHGKPYLLMMGSEQTAFKGIGDIVQAYRRLLDMGHELDLIWITPTAPKAVDPLVSAYFVSPPQEQIAACYRGATLFVSGSHYESFSLPVLEAMACGCPVVTTSNEGVREYAEDETNVLMAAIANPADLAKQSDRVLNNETLRKRIVSGGLRTAARFRWESIMPDVLGVYRDMAAFEPKPLSRMEEWELLMDPATFQDVEARVRFERFLAATAADEVFVPVVFPLHDGRRFARWLVAAERKLRTGGGGERIYCLANAADGQLKRLPYLPAYESYLAGDLRGAASAFAERAKRETEPSGVAVYLRWVALCLIGLGQFAEARKHLQDMLAVCPDNIDLTLLLARTYTSPDDMPNRRRTFQTTAAIGEAAGYEEFYVQAEAWSVSLTTEKERKPRITLIAGSLSGCNATALYRRMPERIAAKYDVRLVQEKPPAQYGDDVRGSDAIVTTHRNYPYSREQVNIELWHGFPLKGMANMDFEDKHTSDQIAAYWRDVDAIASYSPLYTTVFNACMGAKVNKYHLTGAPRNDALFDSNGRGTLERLLEADFAGKRMVFYMPTFRKVFFNENRNEGNKHWDNVFGFDTFEPDGFDQYLRDRRMTLVVKLHPVEESLVLPHIRELKERGIHVLTSSHLQRHGVELYETLNAADALITDYSSVYFDFLLLDRPLLFAPVDLDVYQQKRGFLLNPYTFWTPGPKVTAQEELQRELDRCFADDAYYRAERMLIKQFVHQYDDGEASRRVWSMIEEQVDRRLAAAPAAEQAAAAKAADPEAEALKEAIRNKIAGLIESGELDKAEAALREYETGVSADAESTTMKAVIRFMKQETDEALRILLQGYSLYPTHFDIIFNLAYVYDTMGDGERALSYYDRALGYAPNGEMAELIKASVERLKQ